MKLEALPWLAGLWGWGAGWFQPSLGKTAPQMHGFHGLKMERRGKQEIVNFY